MYDIKKQLAWSGLKVGIVITLALVTLLATVFFAGDIENMLSPKASITIDIKDVRGLRRGSPVWFSGVEVGSVKSIDLHPVHGTVVLVSLDREVLQYVRKDSRAVIQTMGLLGDKYIELGAGSPEAGPLQTGDMMEGTTEIGLQDVVATGVASFQKLNDLIGQLSRLVEMTEKGEGSVAQFLNDPSLYNNLKDASQRIAAMTTQLQDKKGTFGMLMGDDLLYNKLLSTTESMEMFSDKLNKGNGTLNRLLDDSTLYNRLLGVSSSMEDFSRRLSKGPGTLNRLIDDPELYNNLSQASGSLASILHTLDSGKGAAGTFIRDEELAQELKETVRELKDLTADIRENPRKYFKFSIF